MSQPSPENTRQERRCRRFRGFTLVELLVVMALIVILIALLLPALHGARLAGEQVRCDGNLAQIVKAQLSYAADFGEYTFQYTGKPRFPGAPLEFWYTQAARYEIDVTKLVCPTYWNQGFPWKNNIQGTYAINVNYGQWSGGSFPQYPEWRNDQPPRRLSLHLRPSAEASHLDRGGNPTHPLGPDSDPYFGGQYQDLASEKYCAGFHQDGFEVGYLDGHVRHMSRTELTTVEATGPFWGHPAFW